MQVPLTLSIFMKTVMPPEDILYSIQLYDAGLEPKMLVPLTTDPADDADVVPDGALTAVVAPGVAAVVPPVVGEVGLVLEHPAIATAITISMIAMIPICEIFKSTPSLYYDMPDNAIPDGDIRCRD